MLENLEIMRQLVVDFAIALLLTMKVLFLKEKSKEIGTLATEELHLVCQVR